MENNKLANAIRFLSIDAVQAAKSGHPGMPMGMADIAVSLWKNNLKHNPANPKWINRDRFVLSNGHGSMLLYSLLYLTGYKKMTISPCISICKMDPITGYCYGCGRSTEEKIKWKAETTTEEWKQENIKIIVKRLDGWHQ